MILKCKEVNSIKFHHCVKMGDMSVYLICATPGVAKIGHQCLLVATKSLMMPTDVCQSSVSISSPVGVAGPADVAAQLQPAVSILVSRAEQKGGVSLQHTLSKFYCLDKKKLYTEFYDGNH